MAYTVDTLFSVRLQGHFNIPEYSLSRTKEKRLNPICTVHMCRSILTAPSTVYPLPHWNISPVVAGKIEKNNIYPVICEYIYPVIYEYTSKYPVIYEYIYLYCRSARWNSRRSSAQRQRPERTWGWPQGCPLSETECKDDPVLKSKKYIVKHQICGSGSANNVKLKNPVLFFPLQCTLYSTLQY